MDLVFTTDDLEPSKRYAAWQGAICDVYFKPSNYEGFIREAKFGPVTMTDVLLSEQRISRRERHIAKLDKDCDYVEFVQQGKINVLQAGWTPLSNPGAGAEFSASEAAFADGVVQVVVPVDHSEKKRVLVDELREQLRIGVS